MQKEITGQFMRKVLLEVIAEKAATGNNVQQVTVLKVASSRLNLHGVELEQALLTYWYDLFRTGYLSWGYNLANPDPPFCHLTDQGRKALKNLSRDPSNLDGYLNYISGLGKLNQIADSYLKEALNTFNSDFIKSAAVMIGAAAETIILELCDTLVIKMKNMGKTIPRDLKDWRIKRVIDALKKELDDQKDNMTKELSEEIESYWPAFTQQIRSTRNEAGHPKNTEPVTYDTVHASLLIFPELVKLASNIKSWISDEYK